MSDTSAPVPPRPDEWIEVKPSHADPKAVSGYIPRSVVEGALGIDLGDFPAHGRWFSREESEAMRAHPAWRTAWFDE